MHPIVRAVLFLLERTHRSGNSPEGEAEQLIADINAEFNPAGPPPPPPQEPQQPAPVDQDQSTTPAPATEPPA